MLTPNTFHSRFLDGMQAPELIHNLRTRFIRYEQDGVLIPTTVNDGDTPGNCYAVAPVSLIIDYARDELPKIRQAPLRALCRLLIALLEPLLRRARMDRIQILNNQCLSTNMYPESWRRLDLPALRRRAVAALPRHAVMLRSVNARQQPELLDAARRDGWLLLVTRQVYLCLDAARVWARTDTKADDRLLQEPGWSFRRLDPDDAEAMRLAEQRYRQLYIDKYSACNIQFSAAWMQMVSRQELVELTGLYRDGDPTLLGVVGVVRLDRCATVPVVGYDTSLPAALGLYRRLVAYTLQQTLGAGLALNQSAGVPTFKRTRGAEPCIEYSLVYTRHLGLYARCVWRLMSLLSRRVYQPILERYGL